MRTAALVCRTALSWIQQRLQSPQFLQQIPLEQIQLIHKYH